MNTFYLKKASFIEKCRLNVASLKAKTVFFYQQVSREGKAIHEGGTFL